MTEVPGAPEKAGVEYDDGAEEPQPSPEDLSAALSVDDDEMTDEELEEEMEDAIRPVRPINLADIQLEPKEPQQPHQPLRVGEKEDGVSGS